MEKRLNEEEDAKLLAYGSIKVSELADLLGGAAREPFFLGSGWEASPGEGIDPCDPKAVAAALETGARRNTRIPAFGAILTLPKSASLLAAFDQGDPERMKNILGGMVQEYMRVLEGGSQVRFGNGGYQKVPVRGLKAWAVIHAASAGGDPHFHVHLIISATAETIDGRKGQIDGEKLLGETARLADGSAKRVMAERLEEMGYGIGLDGDVVGVDKELIERASSAGNSVNAIRTFFASRGIAISDKVAWNHWRQVAAGKPDKVLSKALIGSIGEARGEKLGGEAIEHAMDESYSDPHRRAALRDWLSLKYQIPNWKTLEEKARKAWRDYPLYDDVTKVVALMAMLPTPPTPASVEGLCARFADDDHRADLMDRVGGDPRVLRGDKHWALTAQFVREREIITRTKKLIQADCGDIDGTELLTDKELPLCVIQGVAGAGKSRTLERAAGNWKADGVTVWAVARNRLTAIDTGVAAGASKSRTLSSYALRERVARSRGPRPGDVLVVDEFGLLDHADVEMVLSLAEEGVRVKALGDSHQIQPIDSSTSARLVMDIAEAHNMASSDYSWRCKSWGSLHDSLREVVTGGADPKEVTDELEICRIESPGQAVEIAKGHEGAEIAVQSNEMRCEIAEHLPRPRRPEELRKIFMTRDGTGAWSGDQVVIRRNMMAQSRSGKDAWLYNGQRARVAQVSRNEIILMTDSDLVKISHHSAQEALSLGGVWTADSAQGQTWERAVVVLTGTESREWLYSAATRGRNAPLVAVLSDEGEDPRSIVEAVLTREGIARTVDEMCRSDQLLARSVREVVEARWSGSQDGPSSNGLKASDGDQLLLPFREPPIGEEPHDELSSEPEPSEASAEKVRRYLGGFFYVGENGEWRVDSEKRSELYQIERERLGLGDSWGGRQKEAAASKPFRTDTRREIIVGSGEFYDPVLDPSNEDYLPGLRRELQDRQCERAGRIYQGGFFYQGRDGVWRVDFQKREEQRWEAEEIPMREEDPKRWRSLADDIFDISTPRPVVYGEEIGYYDPDLDDYAVSLKAAQESRAEMLRADVDGDKESEDLLAENRAYRIERDQDCSPEIDPPAEREGGGETPEADRGAKPNVGGYGLRL